MNDLQLKDFTKEMLEEYVFPGTDAAVVFVADGTEPSQEVKEVLDRSYQQRWYPVAGGQKAKVPYHFSEGRENLFEREEKGWTHEHCDFCNASIKIGELCWTTPHGGGIIVFCKACYDTLPPRKRWWQIWKSRSESSDSTRKNVRNRL